MLAESVEKFEELELKFGGFPVPYFLCMVGILIGLFSERVGQGGNGGHGHSHAAGVLEAAGEKVRNHYTETRIIST